MNTLEKLQTLTDMIEESTGGRQRLVRGFSGGVDIQTEDDAHAGLLLKKKLDYDTGDITLGFQATVCRMGSWMNAKDFNLVAEEIQEMNNLLYELEQTVITVSQDEMRQWANWLGVRQVELAVDRTQGREFQPEPTMEIT